MGDQRSDDYWAGLRAGIRRYAYWQRTGPASPSRHVVGESALPLEEALARVDRDQAHERARAVR